jgi:hypothetical protein
MRPYTTTMLTLWCLASESSEITGSGDARVETNQAQKTQEDARKCGDLLLIAEAMLEIVKTHNRESLSQLDVRIGALCCAFCVPSYSRTHWSTFLCFHINPVCARGYKGTPRLSLPLSVSLSLSHTHTTHHRYRYWERGGRYAWRSPQALLCARSIKYD